MNRSHLFLLFYINYMLHDMCYALSVMRAVDKLFKKCLEIKN